MPTERVVRLVADLFGTGSVVGLRALRSDRAGPWIAEVASAAGRTFEVVLRGLSGRIGQDFLATNAAALRVAERHGVPAPRLLGADLSGRIAGTPVTVESVVGATCWPPPAP